MNDNSPSLDPELLDQIRGLARDDGAYLELVGIVGQLHRERAELTKVARQSRKLEAVGQLAAGIAHDFNNLLTVILTYAESLRYELPEIDSRRQDVDEIRAAASRAATLTRQLLAFSRRGQSRPEEVDLNASVDATAKLLRRLIGANIDLKQVYEEELGKIWVDPGSVEQIVMNLVILARDGLSNGGRITIETANVLLDGDRARQLEVKAGHYARLSVADSPPGSQTIPPMAADPGTQRKRDGLASISGIVAEAKGSLTFSSTGIGGRVDVFLPWSTMGQTPGPLAPVAPRAEVPKGHIVILLVEDDPALRRLASRLLRDQGYEVLAARDGEHALAKASLHGGGIDLILTDVVMPRMGGHQLAAQLRRINPVIKVLFTSGYSDPDVEKLPDEDPGQFAFLPKPYTRNRLLAEVGALLAD